MRLIVILKRVLIGALLAVVAIVVLAVTMPFARGWLGIAGPCAGAVAVFSLTALVCAAARQRGRMPSLMLTGLVASFAATAGWILIVTTVPFVQYPVHHWLQSLWPVTIWAWLCAVIGGLYGRRIVSTPVAIVRGLVTLFACLLAALLVLAVWFSDFVAVHSEVALPVFAVVAVLTVCGGLITGVLAVLPRLRGERRDDVERLDLTVTCPRCGTMQPFTTGGGACAQCRLQISVVVP